MSKNESAHGRIKKNCYNINLCHMYVNRLIYNMWHYYKWRNLFYDYLILQRAAFITPNFFYNAPYFTHRSLFYDAACVSPNLLPGSEEFHQVFILVLILKNVLI